MNGLAVNPEWIRAALKRRRKSRARLAKAMGISAPALTNALQGKRKLSMQEAQIMADELGVPVSEVFTAFALTGRRERLTLLGYAGAGDRVVLFENGDSGLEEVDSPFPGYSGTVLRIRGSGYAPRYLDNELIAYGRGRDAAGLIGKEVVALTAAGDLVLKRLARGTLPDTYTLLSIDATTPPALDVRLQWAAPIDWHRP